MSDSDIVQDFLVESAENLDRLDRDLVGLEKNPRDNDALAGIFRTIHTIKCTCGCLGLSKLEKVAHVGENLLTRLRDGQLNLTPEITTALLNMVDAVRQMMKEIQSNGRDGDQDYPDLREILTRLQGTRASNGASNESSAEAALSPRPVQPESKPLENPQVIPTPLSTQQVIVQPPPTEKPDPPRRNVSDAAHRKPTHGKIGGVLVERGVVQAEDIARALEEQERGDQ